MKETPILFSGQMVRAILDERKTQTRRLLKPQPFVKGNWGLTWEPKAPRFGPSYCERNVNWNPITNAFEDFYRDRGGSPFGKPGDRLWVKETFSTPWHGDVTEFHFTGFYRADDAERKVKWKPSIFMPRWASRITLEITSVRVERLHEISEADAKAEGCSAVCDTSLPTLAMLMPCDRPATRNYCKLWESINGAGSWDSNPWVWVIEFRRVEQ